MSVRLLPAVIELAKRAGKAILEVYDTDFAVEAKADDSPLTQADRAAHEVIVAGLKQLDPVYPVLSEEAAGVPYATRAQWTTYWLVDPLDGTREFVKRNGEFTVNIALIHAHEPVLGVVHAPVLGQSFYAARAHGAFRQRGTTDPEPIRVTRPPAVPLRVVGSRSHRGSSLDALLERLGPHEMVSMGSSLKLCLVAAGDADFYPRLGPTSEWDTAAADAVVREAGGHVVEATTLQPLRYNTREEVLNPHFLVYGDPDRPWGQYLDGVR